MVSETRTKQWRDEEWNTMCCVKRATHLSFLLLQSRARNPTEAEMNRSPGTANSPQVLRRSTRESPARLLWNEAGGPDRQWVDRARLVQVEESTTQEGDNVSEMAVDAEEVVQLAEEGNEQEEEGR